MLFGKFCIDFGSTQVYTTKTLCGALLEFQLVKPGGQGRKSLPWVCCAPFCRLTGKDRPFQAADDVLSAAFCDTHFRGMEQRAHSIVLPSVVLKGRYYMTQGQDLLTGSVPKKLIRFAFPLFLANLLQALYNVVDMLVVGKIVGKTGLAAISNASMLCFIINSLCIGLTMGGSVLVAQCKGANDQTGQRDTIGMLFFLSLVGSAVVTILGLAIYEALFQALNVPANAYQDACGYMKIICCGTVFVFGYNAVCSILKGLGDSQTPLFFVGVATVLNVVLDVLLVLSLIHI